MLRWKEQFETGHTVVDAQHRMLVTYLNRLERMSQNTNPSPEEVVLFFRFTDFLEGYVITHFKEEEECMHRFRCPAHQQNQAAHGKFLKFFRDFNRRLELEGYRPEIIKELFDACAAWIQEHILRVDTQLKPCRTPFYLSDQTE